MPTYSDPNHIPVPEVLGVRPENVKATNADSIKQILLDIRRLLMEADERRRERPKSAAQPLTRQDVHEIVKYELTKIPAPSIPYPGVPWWQSPISRPYST